MAALGRVKLRFSSRALRQIGAIHDFIAETNETAAIKTVQTIVLTCNRLTDFPTMGRSGTQRGTREWSIVRLRYVVVYKLDLASDELVIVSVLHTRRNRTRH